MAVSAGSPSSPRQFSADRELRCWVGNLPKGLGVQLVEGMGTKLPGWGQGAPSRLVGVALRGSCRAQLQAIFRAGSGSLARHGHLSGPGYSWAGWLLGEGCHCTLPGAQSPPSLGSRAAGIPLARSHAVFRGGSASCFQGARRWVWM